MVSPSHHCGSTVFTGRAWNPRQAVAIASPPTKPIPQEPEHQKLLILRLSIRLETQDLTGCVTLGKLFNLSGPQFLFFRRDTNPRSQDDLRVPGGMELRHVPVHPQEPFQSPGSRASN